MGEDCINRGSQHKTPESQFVGKMLRNVQEIKEQVNEIAKMTSKKQMRSPRFSSLQRCVSPLKGTVSKRRDHYNDTSNIKGSLRRELRGGLQGPSRRARQSRKRTRLRIDRFPLDPYYSTQLCSALSQRPSGWGTGVGEMILF